MPIQVAKEQYTQEWFDARIGKVAASSAAAILSLPGAYQTREKTMRSMVRGYFGIKRNENRKTLAMDWGTAKEHVARQEFEIMEGVEVTEHGTYAHDDHPWLIASPDGQITGHPVGVEIKCPFHWSFQKDKPDPEQLIRFSEEKVADNRIDKKPGYYAQMQIQMAIMGWEAVQYVIWTPAQLQVDLVTFDPSWWQENLPKLRLFYEEFLEVIAVKSQYEPMLEDDEVDLSDDLAWCTNASKLAGVQEKLKELQDVETLYKQKLITIAEGHNKTCKGGGYAVIRRAGSSRIDYKAVVADVCPEGTDFTKYKKVGKANWAVTPQKLKEAI